MINLTFYKIKNIFIYASIFCLLCLGIYLLCCIIVTDRELDLDIISMGLIDYTHIFKPNSIERVPCEEVLKLFPNIRVNELSHSTPAHLDNSGYLVSYITGSKKSYFAFLEFNLRDTFLLSAISDEPRCFKALGTFIEAVNDSTSK